MNEIWKDIRGYRGKYKISNLGNVMSFAQHTDGKQLKPLKHQRGYRQVILRIDGNVQSFLIHRLVANAFIDVEIDKRYVNHIDGNKSNNNVSNLEWVTCIDNSVHAFTMLTFEYSGKKLSESDVLSIQGTHGTLSTFELAAVYNVSRKQISNILNGKCWNKLYGIQLKCDLRQSQG